MNVNDARDSHLEFWASTANPLAAGVVRSPIFYCDDAPDYLAASPANANDAVLQVRGPGVDCCIIIATASAGATLALLGADDLGFTTGVTIWSAAVVAAAGTYTLPSLLASAMAAAPETFNSPCRFWKFSFNNGASNQAAGWKMMVRGGGWA